VESIDNLVYGVNILTISEETNYESRYSSYTVKGQDSGDGQPWAKDTIQKVGKATDISIDRYRPLLIVHETKSSTKSVKSRAVWEAQVRAGRSSIYTTTVEGFIQQSNKTKEKLWTVGEKVNLIHDPWKITDVKLISNVTYKLDETNGRITTLVLVDPKTYAPSPDGEIRF
jgi:prophage tail gpP-like protein